MGIPRVFIVHPKNRRLQSVLLLLHLFLERAFYTEVFMKFNQ